jgi:hypothetical protein
LCFIAKSEDFRADELIYKSEAEKYDKLLTDFINKTQEYKTQEKEIKISLNSENEKSKKRSLKKRLDDLTENYSRYKRSIERAKDNFKAAEKTFRNKKTNFWESKKKRNLVYIGRGWVKAGIEFSELNENDIIVDEEDSLSIHIVINTPIILDIDINPWFIYTDKKKIKGYELFIEKTGSMFSEDNFTDDEISAVKTMCKNRLKEEAIKKGLLKNAKSSAVTTLENFFHLVGFEKVTVRFKKDKLIAKQ